MRTHLKELARSWFSLTSGEQQALGLLLLLLFLGTLGRWGYTRHYGTGRDKLPPPACPPIESLLDE
jgi:hypothetical protein